MKNIFRVKLVIVAVFLVFSLLFFVSSSVWEGWASTSTESGLPSIGLFAATDSFPRNTVVDIMNLENGQTVKAVVSQGLDTPGLLVVLSRDAAAAIGLSPRSLGRVRMSQSPDTVSSQITGSVFTPGDPDHDPAAHVFRSGGLAVPLKDDTEELFKPGAASVIAYNDDDWDDYESAAYSELSERDLWPEDPEIAYPGVPDQEGPAEPEMIETELLETEPAQSELVQAEPAQTETEAAEPYESLYLPGEPDVVVILPHEVLNVFDNFDYFFEPASNRVPEAPEVVIDQRLIIPGIPQYTQPQSVPLDQYPSEFYPRVLQESGTYFVEPIPPMIVEQPQQKEAYIDPAFIIPSISGTASVVSNYSLSTDVEPPQYVIPVSEHLIIPEIPAYPGDSSPPVVTAPPIETTPPIVTVPPVVTVPPETDGKNEFSVPVINSLDRGRYYVQVLAGSQAEGIESEIKKIGSHFPVTVQKSGSGDRPWYRLLIGPVNLGESGALLERFKQTYRDAFVRYGG